MSPEILTEEQVAERLGVTHRTAKRTIQRLLREGIIRGNKIGREWRIHEEAIRDFLLSRGNH